MAQQKQNPSVENQQKPQISKESPPAQPPVQPPVLPQEKGGRKGPEPTRYGDWELNGKCVDF